MNMLKLVKAPDLVSLLSLAFAMLSIFSSIERDFNTAMFFMILSVVADYSDGMLARLMHRTGNFGKQVDSLADIIAFGVTPAVFGYMVLGRDTFTMAALVIFTCAGLLRLARYNISPASDYFEGLPITSSALLIPAAYTLLPLNLLPYLYLLLAALMISSIKVSKLKLGKKDKKQKKS
ncbi:CDP-diacylglycerol--serine O-phosphatidyltransferase [Candidatus Woesearchaeota archaeon]|nr:CDP-diacylglycerol--serine O-phosphatidyltransferase [Candidatus Woesearchaeota archaeon]